MIKQPERGTRNVNDHFYEHEGQRIDRLNEVLGEAALNEAEERTLTWLAGWEKNTVENLISAFAKAQNLGQEICKEKPHKKLQRGGGRLR